MAKSVWQKYIVAKTGFILGGASIDVRLESSGELATIFSDQTGAALSNPFTAGADGLARFYADAGVYKITATHTLVSSSFRNQQLGNAASRDVGISAENLVRYADAAASFNQVLQFKNQGANIGALGAGNSVNFTGAGVVASEAGGVITVTVAGGGTSIPVISANVTKTVGAAGDFTTWLAALNWVRSALRLNGAIVTLNYLDATCTEQIVLKNEVLDYVIIKNAASVNVTPQTAWVSNPRVGTPGFFDLTNSTLLQIYGSWISQNTNAIGLVVADNSKANIGMTSGPTTELNSFAAAVIAINNSDTFCESCSFTGNTYGLQAADGARAELSSCTIANCMQGVIASGNASIACNSVTYNNVLFNICAVGGSTVIDTSGTYNETEVSTARRFFQVRDAGSTLNVKDPAVSLVASSSARLVEAIGGVVHVDTVTGSGTSTGARVTVSRAAIVIVAGGVTPTFAADNQAANTITSAGLIIA